jgi:hypothetical protein
MPKDFHIITLRTDVQPWEQQLPRETVLQYSRFRVFRDLGPETDRLRQTVEVLAATGDAISYQTIKDISSSFRWTPRAAAWDRYTAQADRARLIKRRRKAIDDQCKAADRLREKGLAALARLDVDDLNAQDIVRFIDLALKIENSVFREAIEPAVVTSEVAKADVQDIAAWTPAERRRRLESLRVELTQRSARAADDDEVVA